MGGIKGRVIKQVQNTLTAGNGGFSKQTEDKVMECCSEVFDRKKKKRAFTKSSESSFQPIQLLMLKKLELKV